jgi:hypothetical protein
MTSWPHTQNLQTLVRAPQNPSSSEREPRRPAFVIPLILSYLALLRYLRTYLNFSSAFPPGAILRTLTT